MSLGLPRQPSVEGRQAMTPACLALLINLHGQICCHSAPKIQELNRLVGMTLRKPWAQLNLPHSQLPS